MDDKTKLSPEEREERRRKAQAGSQRRQLIEHTQRVPLTEEEIAERKKAHAERRAKQKKQAAKKKKQQQSRRESESSGQRAMPMKGTSLDKKSDAKKPVKSKQKPVKTAPAPAEKPAKEKKAKKPSKEKAKKAKKDSGQNTVLKPVEPPRTAAEEYAARAAAQQQEEAAIDMDDFRRARSMLKSRKRLKKLIIVLILVIIAAAVYYTRGLWVPKLEGILDKPHETVVNDGTVQSGYFPIDVSGTASQISRLDGSLIYVDNGHIYTYDQNGKLRNTDYHSFGNPVLDTNGKRMLLFDNKASGFKLYNKSGEMFEKRVDGTILYGKLAENGNVLIVSEDDKYTVSLAVYDKNGTVIYNWQNGDRIVNASFTDGGDGIVVTTFDIISGSTESRVSYCDITKSGSVITCSGIEGLAVAAFRNKSGNIWALTRNDLLLYSDAGLLLTSCQLDTDVTHYDFCEDCACICIEGVGHNTEKTFIFDSSDKTLTPVQPAEPVSGVKRIRCFDGIAFVLGSGKLDAYAPDGSLVSTAAVTDEHNDFVYIDEAVFLVGKRSINKIVFEL